MIKHLDQMQKLRGGTGLLSYITRSQSITEGWQGRNLSGILAMEEHGAEIMEGDYLLLPSMAHLLT